MIAAATGCGRGRIAPRVSRRDLDGAAAGIGRPGGRRWRARRLLPAVDPPGGLGGGRRGERPGDPPSAAPESGPAASADDEVLGRLPGRRPRAAWPSISGPSSARRVEGRVE